MDNLGGNGVVKRLIPLWLAVLSSVMAAGCGPAERLRDAAGAGEPVKIVLTTGFQADEVFRLEDASCSKQEIMVYLATERCRYETVYGPEIWDYLSEVWEVMKEAVYRGIRKDGELKGGLGVRRKAMYLNRQRHMD